MLNVPIGYPLSAMGSSEVRDYLSLQRIVLVPFGATEQHGPALPVGSDTFIAEAIAAATSDRTGFTYAPTVPYGLSAFHMAFPGTISLSVQTYGGLVKDTLGSLRHHGFTRQVLVNAHFENSGVLRAIAEELASSSEDLIISICDFWDLPTARTVANLRFKEPGGHADAADAALILHLAGSTVRPGEFTEEWPNVNAVVSPDLVPSLITKSGVINSDQRSASNEAGAEYFDAIVTDVSARATSLSIL